MTTKRIAVWSGPRNGSTAFMYSFAQRSDTTVLDEPLYGHYLERTGAVHPGRDEVLSKLDTRANSVIPERIFGEHEKPVLFIKDMPHHLVGLDVGFLDDLTNIFLIRNPKDMLSSLVKYIPNPEMLDTAYKMQYKLFERLKAQGTNPMVIDVNHLRSNPEKYLKRVCDRTGLNFENAMLHWKSGALPEEGIWAKYWYDSVHSTTGFIPYEKKDSEIPEHLEYLMDECYEYYLKLYEYTLVN